MREVRKSLLEGKLTHLSLFHSPKSVTRRGECASSIAQRYIHSGDLVETVLCACIASNKTNKSIEGAVKCPHTMQEQQACLFWKGFCQVLLQLSHIIQTKDYLTIEGFKHKSHCNLCAVCLRIKIVVMVAKTSIDFHRFLCFSEKS